MTKERNYRHFDDPLPNTERSKGFKLNQFAPTHRFLPLLGFTDEKRTVHRDDGGKLRTKIKPRPIRYAAHQDAAYLQAYSEYLSGFYEKKLFAEGLEKSVLAYRPTGLTNIHHAKSLFDEIRSRGSCNVVAIDISGFFDTLDHLHLKTEIASVISENRLDGHHWTAFRNTTHFSWVETTDLDEIIGKDRKSGSRICFPADFRRHVRGAKSGLVRVHDLDFGIPQGTPISGLYANLYLMSFDRAMIELMHQVGGSYRRYSDDIALAIPLEVSPREMVDIVQKILADYKLSLSEHKTDISTFSGVPLACDEPIQYLGFVFDGKNTVIRESSLDRYREKMRKGIHAKLVVARQQGIPLDKVYKREALSRYTHLGKRRNFLKYAYRASDILEAPEIRHQVKGHMRWFNRSWNREIHKVGQRLNPNAVLTDA